MPASPRVVLFDLDHTILDTDGAERAALRAAGIEHRFEVIVTSDFCGFAKPDPRILHHALGALGASPGEAAYVGDDAHADGGAAQAAGVRFWWIDRGLGGAPPAAMDRRLTSVRGVARLLAPIAPLDPA